MRTLTWAVQARGHAGLEKSGTEGLVVVFRRSQYLPG
jgi:hypothetical protein